MAIRSGIPITRKLPSQPSPVCQQVFQLLLVTNRERNVGATLRVAGGWVRDALLGKNPHDIDIAVESPSTADQPAMNGEAFAAHIAAYQREHNMEEGTISVVNRSDTAQITICGMPIEFSGLKGGVNGQPATPATDAAMRDFTVNALYYNLHTQQVEDYTTGLEDMQRAVLRCPFNPLDTLNYDPLRIFRGVRFAGQLGYELDASVVECLQVHGMSTLFPALKNTISAERIAVELIKALGGVDPGRCLHIMNSSQLLYAVVLVERYFVRSDRGAPTFGGPTRSDTIPTRIEHTVVTPDMTQLVGTAATTSHSQVTAQVAVRGCEWLPMALNLCIPIQVADAEVRTRCSFYAILPCLLQEPSFPDAVLADQDKPRFEIQKIRVQAILNHNLKLPTRIATGVIAMMKAGLLVTPHFPSLLSELSTPEAQPPTTMRITGEKREAVYFALKALKDEPNQTELFHFVLAFCSLDCFGVSDDGKWKSALDIVFDGISAESSLHELVKTPARVKGNVLQTKLNAANKDLGKLLELQQIYLVHHPDATEDDVVAAMKDQYQGPQA